MHPLSKSNVQRSYNFQSLGLCNTLLANTQPMKISLQSLVTLGGVVTCSAIALMYGYMSIVQVGDVGGELLPHVLRGGVDLSAMARCVRVNIGISTTHPPPTLGAGLQIVPQQSHTIHLSGLGSCALVQGVLAALVGVEVPTKAQSTVPSLCLPCKSRYLPPEAAAPAIVPDSDYDAFTACTRKQVRAVKPQVGSPFFDHSRAYRHSCFLLVGVTRGRGSWSTMTARVRGCGSSRRTWTLERRRASS